ncbi:MAG: alpha/beta hydrolase [Anaerolineales bacterium]|nr:alpha/beta hydrolase [Anaerolineales bacterium]
MSIVTLDEDIIHYEVLGRGRPLFFLHGWVGSWRYWIPTMQAASISYRTYALDLWGFGDTAKREDKYTIQDQSALLSGFMDALGIGKIAIVGHGLGAVVGLNFALHNPTLVDRVMLAGFPLSNAAINARLRTASLQELVDWLLGKVPAADAARNEAPRADLRAVQKSLESIEEINLLELTMGITTPCLFVHGLNDLAVEAPDPEVTNTLPEYTHAIQFDASGHFPMLDEPTKYNRLLFDFLSLNSGESPRELQLKEEWKRRIR